MKARLTLLYICAQTLQHAEKSDGFYREEIVSKILQMTMRERHGLVPDFSWYLSTLCSLARLCSFAKDSGQIPTIADELVDIAIRVESVRPFAVESMLGLILDEDIMISQQRVVISKVRALYLRCVP